jgi:CRP/FNR family transcriptional regulator, cyclic AMP receptor protein
VETLEHELRSHPFLGDLPPAYLTLLAGCASNVEFRAGAFLFREGTRADRCFLVREGKVALEIGALGRGPIIIQTVDAGEVTGFSWLLEPHQWQFDGLAIEPVRALALDGDCVRAKCENDPRLGFELMRRFANLAASRLQSARLRLLDVYGTAHAASD